MGFELFLWVGQGCDGENQLVPRLQATWTSDLASRAQAARLKIAEAELHQEEDGQQKGEGEGEGCP